MSPFELKQPLKEPIIVSIADRRIIEDVVLVIVLLDFPANPCDFAPQIALLFRFSIHVHPSEVLPILEVPQ
jgi:hypothetical protein